METASGEAGSAAKADPCACIRGLVSLGIIIADFVYFSKSSEECDSSPVSMKNVFLIDGIIGILPLASCCCFCCCAIGTMFGIAGLAAVQAGKASREGDVESPGPGPGPGQAVQLRQQGSDSEDSDTSGSGSDSDSDKDAKITSAVMLGGCAVLGATILMSSVNLIWCIVGLLSLLDAQTKEECTQETAWYMKILIANVVVLLLLLPAMCRSKKE